MLMSTVSKRSSDAHRARCDSEGTSVHGDDAGRGDEALRALTCHDQGFDGQHGASAQEAIACAQVMKLWTPFSTDIDAVKSKTSLRRCVEAVMPN